MTLAFSTQLSGKPTYFVEKICKSLREHCLSLRPTAMATEIIHLSIYHKCKPKNHTIRVDKKDRWKVGTLIHFVINNRTKNRIQFASVVSVESIQKIDIHYIPLTRPLGEFRPCVKIDNKLIFGMDGYDDGTMTALAHNDGFDSIEDFFAYFNTDFKGKIIHWTDLKY
ncbi:hypothetical protein [Flavobacterium cerinum]|uniref:Uncharacterized protein n=1 Tax=Flavobacterium cerinum TaxID=2502784 RepID=A0A3S3R0S2_9FLAO|nr:hypothetical protein [Flavobacterium cerinum]RWX00938.1 hypothetical protein EPI11_07910 [Flavobacterium cerinum]